MPDKTLGELIRESRKKKGISLAEVARRVGISTPFASDIERGRRNPSDAVLEKIAKVLEMDPEVLRDLNSVAAFWEFRDIVESNREMKIAFTRMVQKLKKGKISPRELIRRFSA